MINVMFIITLALLNAFFFLYAIKITNGIYAFNKRKDMFFFLILLTLFIVFRKVNLTNTILVYFLIFLSFFLIYRTEKWRISLSVLLVFLFYIKSAIFISFIHMVLKNTYFNIINIGASKSISISFFVLIIFLIRSLLFNILYRRNINYYKMNKILMFKNYFCKYCCIYNKFFYLF